MGLKGIDHIVLHVSDIEKSLTFYRRLGFQVLWEEEWRRYERNYPGLRVGPNQTIHLLARETTRPLLQAAHPDPGTADICIVWDGPITEIADLLEKNNITPELGPVGRRGGHGMGTSYYFRDPDGNLIEFITYRTATPTPPSSNGSTKTEKIGL
jgi:catechol 2,3-dioxygenase-like lactoylglutathione lyase family enzyme